jgi:hypothetical protein
MGIQSLLNPGIMWCSGLEAIITSLIRYRSINGPGRGWGKISWQLRGHFLPFIYAGLCHKSNSVWKGMFRHDGHNFILYELDRLTINTGRLPALPMNMGLAVAGAIG